jgi:hypothetical protein
MNSVINAKPVFLKAMINSFDNPNTTFHFLEFDGQIIAFWRFDQEGEGIVHAGSLNVIPGLHGASIGSEVLKNNISEKARSNKINIEAVCRLPVVTHYSQIDHFIADSLIEQPSGQDVEFFAMTRNDRINFLYHYSGADLESVKKAIQTQNPENIANEDIATLFLQYDFSSDHDYTKFKADCKKMFSSGHVLTSFLMEEKKRYCVFERRILDQPTRQAALDSIGADREHVKS